MDWFKSQPQAEIPEINAHIHTPHSFSAFSDIGLAFQMARTENIRILGINDFYTTDGYPEFAYQAKKSKVFPLFNIEFIALQHHLQKEGIRVNDPNNPGRTYLCGKGLRFPAMMSEFSRAMVNNLQKESNWQTYQMVEKLNVYFNEANIDLHFDPVKLHAKFAKGLFRERHIAQAIRLAVFQMADSTPGREKLFERIFSGKKLKSPLENIALVENEIRNNLLKAGGTAFVPEDSNAFLSLNECIDLIIDAGGMPCYPVLLDDDKGSFTDFESVREKLLRDLIANNIFSIELIPGRNDYGILKDFVSFFHQNDFVITFGTEHNTPQLNPLTVSCRGGIPLDNELRNINYEGAAVIAAHQYLIAKGEEGYLNGYKAKTGQREYFIQLGKAVIAWYIMGEN